MVAVTCRMQDKGGEGGREEGREGGGRVGWKGGREGGKEEGWERGRVGGGREEGREGGRGEEREGRRGEGSGRTSTKPTVRGLASSSEIALISTAAVQPDCPVIAKLDIKPLGTTESINRKQMNLLVFDNRLTSFYTEFNLGVVTSSQGGLLLK